MSPCQRELLPGGQYLHLIPSREVDNLFLPGDLCEGSLPGEPEQNRPPGGVPVALRKFVRGDMAEIPQEVFYSLSKGGVVDIRVDGYCVIVSGTIAESQVRVRAPARDILRESGRGGSPFRDTGDLPVLVFAGGGFPRGLQFAPR